MYDGSIKLAKDIVPNDILMGDDSTPRIVVSITSGTDQMYEIDPTKGRSYRFYSVINNDIGEEKLVYNQAYSIIQRLKLRC